MERGGEGIELSLEGENWSSGEEGVVKSDTASDKSLGR